jgi:hypothetical protein
MLAEFIITDGANYGDLSEKDDEEHRHAAINLNINGEDRSVSIIKPNYEEDKNGLGRWHLQLPSQRVLVDETVGKFDVKKPITVHRAVALLSHDLGLLEDPPELSELLGDKDLDSGKQMSNEERDAATRS